MNLTYEIHEYLNLFTKRFALLKSHELQYPLKLDFGSEFNSIFTKIDNEFSECELALYSLVKNIEKSSEAWYNIRDAVEIYYQYLYIMNELNVDNEEQEVRVKPIFNSVSTEIKILEKNVIDLIYEYFGVIVNDIEKHKRNFISF